MLRSKHGYIKHDIRYIPIFDISIQLNQSRYCIIRLMYHDMVIYRYIVASLIATHYKYNTTYTTQHDIHIKITTQHTCHKYNKNQVATKGVPMFKI